MLKQIADRASVRTFTDQTVDHAIIEELLRAAMAAPSAGNQQPWEFYVATDLETRTRLANCSPYAKPALAAPVVIVPCTRMEGMRFPDYAAQDMSAAVENMLIECVNQGLGAVWMGIAPRQERIDAVRAALDAPESLEPFALIAVGHPADAVNAHAAERFDSSRVHDCTCAS